MIAATRSGNVGERDGRYDFDRLERSVEFLLAEHERLSAEHEALLGELRERGHRIAQLESRLESERATRRSAAEDVTKILSRLEQLQASVRAATENA
jgi:DNA repair exonuclease SbcCD ATPase subunit